jgi:ketosteroid isomerase-like protein
MPSCSFPTRLTRGQADIRELLTSLFGTLRIESLETQVDTIEVFDDVAYEWDTSVSGTRRQESPRTQEEGRYLMRWARQDDGSWRVSRFAGNTVKKEPVKGR